MSEVERDGGHLVRLGDGRVSEYFQFGSTAPEAELMVFFHGYTLSGSSASSWHDVCLAKNVRMIGISMAGWYQP